MKRLYERNNTMTSTMNRRSILKYAAAMGAALVLPAGVAKAVDDKTGNMFPAPAEIDLAPRVDDDPEHIRFICEHATRLFRDDMTVWDHLSQERCIEELSDASWPDRKVELMSTVADALESTGMHQMDARLHAQFVIWGLEARAAGYAPSECFIEYPVINGKRVMSLVMRPDTESQRVAEVFAAHSDTVDTIIYLQRHGANLAWRSPRPELNHPNNAPGMIYMINFEDPRHELFTNATREILEANRDAIWAFFVDLLVAFRPVVLPPGGICALPDLY